MKPLVDSDVFKYYLMASADYCIVSTTTYFPLIAIELDSSYHDMPRHQQNDAKKDLIFQLGGVGLIRLRPFGRPTAATVRSDIVRALMEYGELHRGDERAEAALRALNLDGLSQDYADIDELKS